MKPGPSLFFKNFPFQFIKDEYADSNEIKKTSRTTIARIYCNKPDEHETYEGSESGMVYCRHCAREMEVRIAELEKEIHHLADVIESIGT
jgi:hypothetical protein